jgi:tetratricopeptide (TPR) repeat protein
MSFSKWGAFRSLVANVLFLLLVFGKMAFAETERGDYEKQRLAANKEFRLGHYEEAETLFSNAFHGAETNRDDYAAALDLSGLGSIYLTEGRFEEAETVFRKSLAIFRRVPNGSLLVAIELHNLGSSYTAAHRYKEAIAVLQEASRLLEKVQEPHEQSTGQVLNSLGVAYYSEGKTSKAESFFQAAIRSYEVRGNTFAADLAQCFNNLATGYKQRGQFQRAEDAYKRSIALTEGQLGSSHPDLTLLLENLGDFYTDLKRYEEAEAQFKRSLAILEETRPLLTARTIHALNALSKLYLEKGANREAEQVLARAAEVVGPRPAWNPEVPGLLETYAKLLKSTGKSQQAEDLHWRAIRLASMNLLTVHAQDLK